MRLTALSFVLIAGVSACCVAFAADEPSEQQRLAAELLDAMNMEAHVAQQCDLRKAAMKQLPKADGAEKFGPSREEMEEFMEKTTKLFDEELSWDKVKPDYVNLYAETFSAQELKDLAAFYRSPAGRALADKQPELTRKTTEMTQKAVLRLMPKITAIGTTVGKKATPEPVETAK